jgi:YHS domain-containing protein
MVRLLVLAALLAVLVLVLRSVVTAFMAGVRSGARPGGPRHALRDELVKDPVCETYVPRRSATTRTAGSVTHYFCSSACAEKFKAS